MEERNRLRSHFLLDAGDLGSRNLAVTWVDVSPGAEQKSHSHEDSEQVYVVVSGSGRMTVAGDEEHVGPGDLVFIPPATDHSIVNDGDESLVYVSAMPRRRSRWRSSTAASSPRTSASSTRTSRLS